MSSENRKRTRSERSGRSVATRAPKRRKTEEISSPTKPRLPPLNETTRFFHANEYVIVKAAHDMVGKLVRQPGPYRRKLLDLVKTSNMERENPIEDPRRVHVRETTDDDVVALAWDNMSYYWAKQADTRVREEKATAFASMGNYKEDQRHLQIIAINSCFRQNDCLTEQANGDQILETAMGKRTLLLFFRKIKHEFLHLVHRYLQVEDLHKFEEKLTPTKYTPCKQEDSSTPLPEVGDHDEEEDSGGPILPRYNNKKLSEKNQICVQFNRTFLVLNDAQVSHLLNLDIYFGTVDGEGTRHDLKGCWSFKDSRAYRNNILTSDFFAAALQASVGGASRARRITSRLSSPTKLTTPKAKPPQGRLPLWRVLGNTPFVRPGSSTNSRSAVVSRSSSPIHGFS